MGGRRYETTIGLEVHVQLGGRTKLFCDCAPRFGDPPNSHVCPTCLGLPGALPVLDGAAVDGALRVAAALGADIRSRSRFVRKNYLYPDLPKGYQISQYRRPLAIGGALPFWHGGEARRLEIERIHLEEDAGRSVHVPGSRGRTRIDLNRCGVPLVEIVTRPASMSPGTASAALEAVRDLVRWLDVTDARMEEGSLRCDANVSVRPAGQRRLNPKTELKNLNSFRALRQALRHEERRQRELLEAGERWRRSTRSWDASGHRTVSLRGKEEAPDYRYFPEPDLPEIEVDEARRRHAAELPELPWVRADRYVEDWGLERDAAVHAARERSRSSWLEAAVEAGAEPRRVLHWLLGPVQALADERTGGDLEALSLSAGALAELLGAVADGTVPENLAADVLERVVDTGRSPRAIIDEDGMRTIDRLEPVVERVLGEHPEQVSRYRAGERKLLGWFMGRVMSATDGRADPGRARALLQERLAERQE